MFSNRNFQVSAILDIVVPLKAQCRWRQPYQQRCLPVYVLSLNPALRGHNKNFFGLEGFPANNHKKCIRPSFYHGQQHPVHHRLFPFHLATTAFQYSLRALLVLLPIRDLCGGSYFSQNGTSMLLKAFLAFSLRIPVSFLFSSFPHLVPSFSPLFSLTQ